MDEKIFWQKAYLKGLEQYKTEAHMPNHTERMNDFAKRLADLAVVEYASRYQLLR